MSQPHLRLTAGATDLLGDAYTITVRRGLKPAGVTDDLDPGVITATIRGSETANPLTNTDVRPTQPLTLDAGIEATYSTAIAWHRLFTGTLDRAQIEYVVTDKRDHEAYRVLITGTDPVTDLAAAPSDVAVSGTLAQRVAAVLNPTGLPYTVTDQVPPTTSTPLPTDGKTAVDQLRLIRDTLHAVVYVDRVGNLRAVADNARPRTTAGATHTATDETTDPDAAIHYHELVPAFDTGAVVNLLTIKTLADPNPAEATYTDEDSRAAWGDNPQTLTVNDGIAENHAVLYLATRTDPDLIPERLAFVVYNRDDRGSNRPEHLAAACAMDIADTITVTRAGLPNTTLVIREIEHTITPRLWITTLGLRVPEILATRWQDVPADLTWDNVPADLTWDTAVHWHPYLTEETP